MKNKKFFNNKRRIAKAGIAVGGVALSNAVNFLFSVYLGRTLTVESFATIAFLGGILSLSDIVIDALRNSVIYKSANIFGKFKKPAYVFWKNVQRKGFTLGIISSILWGIAAPILSHVFHLSSVLPLLAISPMWLLLALSAIDGGYIAGNLRLGYIGFVTAFEAITKFALAFALVKFGFANLAYISIPLASLLSTVLLVYGAGKIPSADKKLPSKNSSFPQSFYLSNLLSKVSVASYLSLDVIMAKLFLSPHEAGLYAILSLCGKVVFMAGSLFSQFIVPLVSHFEGSNHMKSNPFKLILAASLLSSLAAFTFIGLFSNITVPLVFGQRVSAILPYVLVYSLSMVSFALATSIISFHQARGRHILPFIGFSVSLLQILMISLFHKNLGEISITMSMVGFFSLITAYLAHKYNDKIEQVFKKITGFVGLLAPLHLTKKAGLRILIFNWRDTKHMWAGGAEVYIHELAKRWVNSGNTVVIFCGNDGLNKKDEIVDGVHIIRRGGFYSVYLWAIIYYILKFRKNFDVIVDSENGIPFFTPLFAVKPVVLLIHHVHQDIFIEQMKFPFSHIGRFIEGKLMPFVYRNKTVVTVSESSKMEIIKAGIAKEDKIAIVNPGIEIPKKKFKKTIFPTLIYLGRLKAYKNIDIAIRAFSILNKRIKSSRMFIVGEGDSDGDLKDLTLKLGLEKKITFFGKVSDEEKVRLLSESWVAIQPSTVEGWGITVLEANACKTPVVASDTKGLRDSIIAQKTGSLVKLKDVKAFSQEVKRLIINESVLANYSNASYKWAQKFRWEENADKFANILALEAADRKPVFAKAGIILNRFTSIF